MKNVTIVVILTVSGFLTACHTKDSNTQTTTQGSTQAPVPVSPSPIDKVRNGYLESNKTTTVGKALEGTFTNGTWKTFITQKGATIVEFDGFEPFSQFIFGGCEASTACTAVYKKLNDYCYSDEGIALYSKDPYGTCWDTTTKQHANDPIPVVVQFSINQDGTTFQYEANDMGLSAEALLEKIYK